jgi:hypothetical protein
VRREKLLTPLETRQEEKLLAAGGGESAIEKLMLVPALSPEQVFPWNDKQTQTRRRNGKGCCIFDRGAERSVEVCE